MNEIFELRKTRRVVQNQYKLPILSQVTFGAKCIRYFGPKIWNSIPFLITQVKVLYNFK